MRRSAFTLIELMLVSVLMAIVMGGVIGLYMFATERAAHGAARYNAQVQLSSLADRIENTIRNSVSCTVVSSGTSSTGLKCTMPAVGIDSDGDGYLDTFTPATTTAIGVEQYGQGKRVTFYTSDAGSGSFTAPGNVLWRAERADDGLPTPPDRDFGFTRYFDTGNFRYPLLTGAVWSVNPIAQSVTFTLSTNSLTRADRVAVSSDSSSQEYSFTITRTVFWRNWRQ